MSAAVSQQLVAAVSDVEALQTTLAAEHAAVYVLRRARRPHLAVGDPTLFAAITRPSPPTGRAATS